MKTKLFQKLRVALFAKDVSQQALAAALGCHPNHINALLNGRASWRLSEMESVLRLLDGESLDEYFSEVEGN